MDSASCNYDAETYHWQTRRPSLQDYWMTLLLWQNSQFESAMTVLGSTPNLGQPETPCADSSVGSKQTKVRDVWRVALKSSRKQSRAKAISCWKLATTLVVYGRPPARCWERRKRQRRQYSQQRIITIISTKNIADSHAATLSAGDNPATGIRVFQHISIDKVVAIIKECPSKRSTTDVAMKRPRAPILGPYFTNIVNISLSSGVLPKPSLQIEVVSPP